MLNLTSDIKSKIKEGEITKKELTDYLVRNHSVFDIVEDLASVLIENAQYDANMIILTPKQHQLLLSVLGKITRPLNTNLGRKPRTKKFIEARVVNTDKSV